MRAFLAVLLSTGLVAPSTPQVPSPLDEGLRLYKEGALNDAVLALDAAIRATSSSGSETSMLIRAYVYKGATLVGLGQEERAKASFREALGLDPNLRLSKTEFPDRVVRVFEAARSGKKKSVMQRPSDAPKKAGIGALGVGAIAGGIALAGGAVAVAVAGSNDESSSFRFPEGFQVRFLSSNPPPGSTISLGRAAGQTIVPLSMTFSLQAGQSATGDFRADLFKDDRNCASGVLVPFAVAAGTTLTMTVPSATYQPDPACALPVTTNRVTIQLLGPTFSGSIEGISYSLVQ